MKIWSALLCLLLEHLPTITSQCEPGEIRLTGPGTNPTAGRIHLCETDREWREVCQLNWDTNDAMVVCRQLGFSTQGVETCRNCLGRSSLSRRVFNFNCIGNEERLINCNHNRKRSQCGEEPGVICQPHTQQRNQTEVTGSSPEQCNQTEVTESPQKTGNGEQANQDATAIIAVLGTLVGVMAIGLVGVVLGWVWSCHRRRQKIPRMKRINDTAMDQNPSYAVVSTSKISSSREDTLPKFSDACYETIKQQPGAGERRGSDEGDYI